MEITIISKLLSKELNPQSILCYGSYGQKLQDEKSDIDLLIIMPSIPSTEVRRTAYSNIPQATIKQLTDSPPKSIPGVDWDNSWSPVNDILFINSHRVEIGYNTVSWIEKVVHQLIVNNQISFEEFPFRPYTFLGLLETSLLLYDKDDFIANMKKRIRPMPTALKNEILETYTHILEESYADLEDCASRNIGILAYQFYLTRAIDAAIQVLFAINEIYDPATKRTEPYLFKLEKQPPHLSEFLLRILPRFYENKTEVSRFFKGMIDFAKRS